MGTDIHAVMQARRNEKWEDVPSKWEQGRHYLLFAWLGNVRNGYGFAGIPTHTPVKPLSDSRGLPADFPVEDEQQHPIASFEVLDPHRQKWREAGDPLEIWMGDHSHSWLTADEILTAKMPTVQRVGVVTKAFYDTWDGYTPPTDWIGDISGGGVKRVDSNEPIPANATHVRIYWEAGAYELQYFVDEVRRLKEAYGEVRFVFGFDS